MTRLQYIQTLLMGTIIFSNFSYGQVGSDSKDNIVSFSKLKKNPSRKGFSRKPGNVYCGLMDKSGNLWFGTTEDGVYRFDGRSFVNYTTKEGLRDNGVYSILEDSSGNIWFGTSSGLCLFDGKTISNISASSSSIITSNLGVSSILQDKKGVIWFATANGVYQYDGKSFSLFLDDDSILNKENLKLRFVDCMLEDKNGYIWFGSGMGGGEGICRFDGKTLSSFTPNGDTWICNMLEDKAGNIWFSGRSHGYFRFDGNSFTDFTEQNGQNLVLGDKQKNICIRDKVGFGPLLEDRNENIWFTGKMLRFGGEGGIWRVSAGSCTNFTTTDTMKDYQIWCMVEDKIGNIWIGTSNTSLFRFDGKNFTSFSE